MGFLQGCFSRLVFSVFLLSLAGTAAASMTIVGKTPHASLVTPEMQPGVPGEGFELPITISDVQENVSGEIRFVRAVYGGNDGLVEPEAKPMRFTIDKDSVVSVPIRFVDDGLFRLKGEVVIGYLKSQVDVYLLKMDGRVYYGASDSELLGSMVNHNLCNNPAYQQLLETAKKRQSQQDRLAQERAKALGRQAMGQTALFEGDAKGKALFLEMRKAELEKITSRINTMPQAKRRKS